MRQRKREALEAKRAKLLREFRAELRTVEKSMFAKAKRLELSGQSERAKQLLDASGMAYRMLQDLAIAEKSQTGLDSCLNEAKALLQLITGDGEAVSVLPKIQGASIEQPTRVELHAVISEQPGITASEIQRTRGMKRSQVTYHLRMLEQAGLIRGARWGNVVGYFPVGANVDPAPIVLRNAKAKKVFDAVQKEPGLDLSGVADRTGLPRGNAHYHLKRLSEAGLVRLSDLPKMQAFLEASPEGL